MKAKKDIPIYGSRNKSLISNPRPMRNGKSGVSKKTSANGKTWDMMRQQIFIPAMQGKKLRPLFIKKQKSKNGYESEVTVYECENCTDCPYKEKCTKAKGNKRLHISKSFLEKRQESYENILSEKGIQYRMNRSIQVEGAFGVLKNDYEFQRFLLRGKTKVKLEILLLSMGYNLNKLHAKIQNERTGSHLFEVKKSA